MLILSIDSTSFLPRISLTDRENIVFQVSDTLHPIDWKEFKSGDGSYIIYDFLSQIEIGFEKSGKKIEEVDIICYSWYSGFRKTMLIGKILSETLGAIYKKKVVNVDHITAHYFSLFVEKDIQTFNYPILFLSASGSHNSFAIMKHSKYLQVLWNDTQYDLERNQYMWLWNIFFRTLRLLKIISESDTAAVVTDAISNLSWDINIHIVEELKRVYQNTNMFDLNFYNIFEKLKYISWSTELSVDTLYLSFQEAIFDIIQQKLEKILFIMPSQTIAIVWWISNNDALIQKLSVHFESKHISVIRPEVWFRLDNAAMLGVLCYHFLKEGTQYDFSQIISD